MENNSENEIKYYHIHGEDVSIFLLSLFMESLKQIDKFVSNSIWQHWTKERTNSAEVAGTDDHS